MGIFLRKFIFLEGALKLPRGDAYIFATAEKNLCNCRDLFLQLQSYRLSHEEKKCVARGDGFTQITQIYQIVYFLFYASPVVEVSHGFTRIFVAVGHDHN